MKHSILILSILLGITSNAQIINDSIISKIENDIELIADIRLPIIKEHFSNNFIDNKLNIEFNIDTFKINMLYDSLLYKYSSIPGMTSSTLIIEKKYSELIEKYFNKLLGKLDIEDQNDFKVNQKNWLKSKEEEQRLSFIISKEKYSGGGSIQRNIVASEYLDYTKERLYKIIYYLNRFY